jgi:ubiquinone/menaquinone biosynthesis C-methylase UbiE
MGEASWQSKDVVEQRRAGVAERNKLMAEANARMFEEAAVGPGMRVLELGAGTGDLVAMLAERVGPEGHVVATDAAPAMLEVARSIVQASGATNVTLDVCDASSLALPEASFDAVVARNLLMFLDLDVALPGMLHVMRPGARLGATVWGPAAHNPFHGLVLAAARAEGGWGDARVEVAQAFSRGDQAMYRRALEKAGFHEVRVHVVRTVRRFASVAEARAKAEESRIHTAPIDALEPGRRAAAWKRLEDGYAAFTKGAEIELPVEWLVLGAGRP